MGDGGNGWGGKREGAGAKKKNPVANDNAAKPTVHATPADRRPIMSDSMVMAVIEAMRESGNRARNRARTPDWNPYIIRPERIGPVAEHIKKHRRPAGRIMAMDDNTSLMSSNQFAVQAWQVGGQGNDAAEGMMFLGYPYLSELSQRAEFRLFGEIMSEEMTRKWIDFRGTDDESTKEKDKPKDRNNDDEEADQRREQTGEKPRNDGRNKEIEKKIVELRDFMEELKAKAVFKNIASEDNYFGISHLYFDLKGADIENLRDPENRMSIGNGRDAISKRKLGRGCLRGIRTIEPVWCYPTNYNASNPLSPSWYDPQVWYVMGAEIHKTRLIPFVGRPVADILKPAYVFGGMPMTQMAQPYVDIWLRTRESVAELIHAFSVMVLATKLSTTTMPGGAGGGGGDVIARMMMANMLRDNQGMQIIDKETEDFKNISAPISGLDALQAQAQEHMFSIGRIPAVKWTGIQPMGLNATSEGELRAFNDTIHGQQEHLFRPGLTTLLDIAQISLWGARDPDITYDFEPLHELTEKERSEVKRLDAETDQIRIDSGIVSTEEVRSKLVADPDSGFHGLDPDDVPDLIEEEMEGLVPPGSGKGLETVLQEAEGEPESAGSSGAPAFRGAQDGGGDDTHRPFGARSKRRRIPISWDI